MPLLPKDDDAGCEFSLSSPSMALETSLFLMILMVSPGKRFMILRRSNSGDILLMIRMSSPGNLFMILMLSPGKRFMILMDSPGNLFMMRRVEAEALFPSYHLSPLPLSPHPPPDSTEREGSSQSSFALASAAGNGLAVQSAEAARSNQREAAAMSVGALFPSALVSCCPRPWRPFFPVYNSS